MALPSSLQRYLISLGNYSWIPVLTMVLGAGLGGFLGVNQPPLSRTYRYQGVLVTTTPPGVFSETGTQIQEAGQVITEDLLLADNIMGFVSSELEEDPQKIRGATQVEIGTTAEDSKQPPGTILVRYANPNEEKAKQGLTLLMDAMREQSRLINAARLRSQIEAIQNRLPSVETALRAAEQKLETYNRKEQVNILAAETGTLLTAITGSQQQQRQLRLSLEGVQAQMSSLEQRLGLSVDQAYVSSALSADPIITNLQAQIYEVESQLTLLKRDLRPEHPTVVELNNRLTTYQTLLEQRAKEVLGGSGGAAPLGTGKPLNIREGSNLDPTRQQLANTLVSLQTQAETLDRQLAAAIRTEQELRREYNTIPNKQLEQTRLAQDVDLKKALYDKIQAALSDAQAAEAETASSLQVAQVPQFDRLLEEVPLPKSLFLAGGAVAGLVGGAGLIFGLSLISRKLVTAREIELILAEQDAPLLVTLPTLEPRSLREVNGPTWEVQSQGLGLGIEAGADVLPLLIEGQVAALDAYERLRSGLRRLGSAGAKMLVVTSPASQEGKSTVAYNLAIACARSGKRALLIEGDLRQPSFAHQLGLTLDPHIRDNPLNYYGDSSECIRPVPLVENLYVVASVGHQPQPSSILEASEFKRLLQDSRGRFDLIVVDSPSLNRYTDALLLEQFTDGILLVVRPRYTEKEELLNALNFLAESQIPLLGTVINDGFIPEVDSTMLDPGDPTVVNYSTPSTITQTAAIQIP